MDELKELPAITTEAKQICNEKELAIDEFYTFAYGDKFVTVCGAVEQTDAQLLHEMCIRDRACADGFWRRPQVDLHDGTTGAR